MAPIVPKDNTYADCYIYDERKITVSVIAAPLTKGFSYDSRASCTHHKAKRSENHPKWINEIYS